jgi:hypothetical protein
VREGPAFRLAMRLVVTLLWGACRRAGVRPWTGVAVADAGAVAAGAAVDDADAAAGAGAGSKRSSSSLLLWKAGNLPLVEAQAQAVIDRCNCVTRSRAIATVTSAVS